ncbi:MAG: hypothetical protein AAF555_04760 [Verrucomicrobiota bacterium]
MKAILSSATLVALAATTHASILISGVIDGSISRPKGIELYVFNNGSDFSDWTIQVESNGGSSWGQIFAFNDLTSATLDEGFYYVTSTDTDMISQFASATASNTFADSSFNQNGNDAFRLLDGGSNVIDIYGDPADVSRSNDFDAAWAYNDSFAYRKDTDGPSATFDEADWTIPGSDFIDSNGGNNALFPAGSFSAIPETSTAIPLAAFCIAGLLIRRRK